MIASHRIAGSALVLGVAAVQILAILPDAGHAQTDDAGAPAAASIRARDLRADLTFLASDLLEGRLVGTAGNRLASAFIGARFGRLGLRPMNGDTYFQEFRLMRASLGAANALRVSVGGRSTTARLNEDFYPHPFSASVTARGGLVFAGFGIVAPDRGHDDYRDADVRGRVVLVIDHAPGEYGPNPSLAGLLTSEAATPLDKTLAAQARGAAAVLFVADEHNHGVTSLAADAGRAWPTAPSRVAEYLLADQAERVRIPAVRISIDLASRLLGGLDQTLGELSRAAEHGGWQGPIPMPGATVDVTSSVERRMIPERNVLAALEGGDPLLRDEWVILGAHLDHEGAQGVRVFSGADDNGSGVVGLLEIAEAYALAAESGRRPRRSVLFAAWNAEERGLLGAWAYVDRPAAPLARTVAVINMDMIGRSEEVPTGGGLRFAGLEPQTAGSNANAVNLLGYSWAPDLSDLVARANAAVGLEVKRRYDAHETLLRRSDQWPFLQRGVPAVWFFTGLHPDYHTPADASERIDYDKLARVARLIYETSWALAEGDDRPAFARPASR